MTVDWVTWSIWLVGFLIMVIWILVPIREFRRLLAKRKSGEAPEKDLTGGQSDHRDTG